MVLRAVYNALHGLARKSSFAPGVGFSTPHVWKARAGFLDLDLNMHMNNASFLYNAELARWDLSGSSGLLDAVMKQRWMFVVGSQAIRYRHSIAPFEKYEIHTRVAAIDDKWMYMEQIFQSPDGKKKIAHATVRAMILDKQGAVSPDRIFEAMNIDPEFTKSAWEHGKTDPVCAGFLEWDAAVHQQSK